MTTYIWQRDDWPHWAYDAHALVQPMAAVSRAQGHLYGRLADVGFSLKAQAHWMALTDDVIKTSEIEGERLHADSVRSSLAKRLGLEVGGTVATDRHVDGVVDMVLDATTKADEPVTKQRLLGWHAALFPTGYSGLSPIAVAKWRDDVKGPMQVVSGAFGRSTVHFEAPPASQVHAHMDAFLQWLNQGNEASPLIKAGLGHLWFVTIHPFDDGNGRIARAIGDLLLARADGSNQRFYSVSAQIQRERKTYYEMLERTQKGDMDVTPWLLWFFDMLQRALSQANQTLDAVLMKARFWQQWGDTPMNSRQTKLLNRLLDGFEGKLTTSKWANIAKCSQDTALRDIQQLIEAGILQREAAGGRSTSYGLCLGESVVDEG